MIDIAAHKIDVILSAVDKASSPLQRITGGFNLLSKEGLAAGATFAIVSKGLDLVISSFDSLIDYIQDGIKMNREFEYSITQLAASMNKFDSTSMSQMKESIKDISVAFGTDLNTVTESLRTFIREGYTASDAATMLYSSMKLATVTGADLSNVMDATNTITEVFNYDIDTAGYVMQGLNKITSTTQLTMEDISNIIAKSSDSIRRTGISYDDVLSIIYNLDKEGKNHKILLTDVKNIIDNYPNSLQNMADGYKLVSDGINDINTKFEKITGTRGFTASQMKVLGQIRQMDLTSGVDFGSMFDASTISVALEFFDELNSKGITTLNQFNAKLRETPEAFNVWSEMPIAENRDILQLIRMYYYTNDQAAKESESIQRGYFKTLASDLDNYKTKISDTTTAMETNRANIADWTKELGRMTAIHNLNSDLHYMELGLKNASYAAQIQDMATRDLVNSIREQQDAIQKLRDANDAYSLSSQKYSLQELMIQRAAMDHHGRLTRSQRKQMDTIEKAQMDLRIKSQENQIAMDTIKQNGLNKDEKRLNEIKTFYGEELYTIQDTYQKEYDALQDRINNEQKLLWANFWVIQDYNQKILQNEVDTFNARSALWASNPALALKILGAQTAPNAFSLMPILPLAPKQSGGYISETRPYLLHAGETVIPANKTVNNERNVRIDVNAKIYNYSDIPDLANKIAQAVAAGYITGVESKFTVG